MPDTTPPSPDDLANTAIEQLAEDESLRGDLTDDGFGPLQAWAFARLQRVAQSAVRHRNAQAAMDAFAQQIRDFVRDAVQAAENGSLGDLSGEVRPRVVLTGEAPQVQAALRALTLGKDADANAQAIAGVLTSTQLPSPPPPPPPSLPPLQAPVSRPQSP